MKKTTRAKAVAQKTQFKLDDNVPIPPRRNAKKWSFEKMKAGQSFFVPITPGHNSAILKAAKREGVAITTRSVVEKGVAGIRVWRVR